MPMPNVVSTEAYLKENKFWNFTEVTGEEGEEEAELILCGDIASQESWWRDTITPGIFDRELKALGDVKKITVRINSGGGDVFAANAIYARLKDHKAHIVVKVDGWAASAATIIVMAGDETYITRNGVFMIHDPKSFMCGYYGAQDCVKMSNTLETIKQAIINGYADKTGRKQEEISQLMSDETWWTGEDAVNNGFIDKLSFLNESEEEESENVIDAGLYVVNKVTMNSSFKNMPDNIKGLFKVVNSTPAINNKTPIKNKESEEKKEMAVEIKNVNDLTNAYPDLVKEIVNTAITGERNRIKAIDEVTLEGYEDLATEAKYEKPITAEALSMQIIAQAKKDGTSFMAKQEEDINNSGVNNVGNAGNPNEGKTNSFEALLDSVFPQ